jgi:hypothetical protein
VRVFIKAWTKVMNADRFDLARGTAQQAESHRQFEPAE